MENSALNHQEGGSHYKKLAIQPFEYIVKMGLDLQKVMSLNM